MSTVPKGVDSITGGCVAQVGAVTCNVPVKQGQGVLQIEEPLKTEVNGRDSAGRFADGNPGGPGRPRHYDLISLVQEHRGNTIEQSLLRAVDVLLDKVDQEGDVAAATLVFNRLCGAIMNKLEHSGSIDIGLAERVQRARERIASRN